MSVTITVPFGKVSLEVSGEGVKECFREIAHHMEYLQHQKCLSCNSEAVKWEVRTSKGGDEYFEVQCLACGHKIDLGQHKERPTLFTKRDHSATGWYDWHDVQREPEY